MTSNAQEAVVQTILPRTILKAIDEKAKEEMISRSAWVRRTLAAAARQAA